MLAFKLFVSIVALWTGCVDGFVYNYRHMKLTTTATARVIQPLKATSISSGGRGGGRSSTGGRGGGGRGGGGKDASIRQARVSRSLRDELSSIICDIDIKAKSYPDDNLLRATSIAEVEVSSDLSFAKVYVSVIGNAVEKRQIFVWLCENVGQVRYSLAQRLKHMRRVPEIFFKLSDNQQAADLVSLIDSLAPEGGYTAKDEEFEFEEEDEDDEEES
jgi:ribosome-binding factor A